MAERRTAKQIARRKPIRLGSSSRLSSWEQRFKELERFKKTHGHCNVPSKYARNPALRHWVANVRKAKKHGTIAEERIRRLDALGFCWERTPPITVVWEQRLNDLKAFKKEHGHCNVPESTHQTLRWAVGVAGPAPEKGRKTRQGKSPLPERSRLLLGTETAHHTIWKQHIHDLMVFKKEHGHCNVPQRYSLNPALGRWVLGVRQRKKRGVLAEDKVSLLDALGFSWVRKLHGVQVPWEQRFNDLKTFKKEYGHCDVPCGYQPNPALGRWVTNLRQRKRRGELTEDKILSLDALGFRWARLETSLLPREPR